MPSYDFSLILAAGKMSHKKILDATNALGEADCTDGTLCGHAEGMEIMFTRSARSLQAAIGAVEAPGFASFVWRWNARRFPLDVDHG